MTQQKKKKSKKKKRLSDALILTSCRKSRHKTSASDIVYFLDNKLKKKLDTPTVYG